MRRENEGEMQEYLFEVAKQKRRKVEKNSRRCEYTHEKITWVRVKQ